MKKYIIGGLTIFLVCFGIMMVYSSSYIWALYKFNNPFKYLINQSVFGIVGIFLMFVLSKINYKIYYKYSNALLGISIILLILVLIPGIGVWRNGARSWFGIGGFGIQPSELAKLSLIIFTSKYLSKYSNDMKHIVKFSFPIFLVIFFVFFLIMLEPDFGSGVIIVMSLVILIFTSNIPLSFFVKLGLLGVVGVALLIVIAPYRLARITSFLNPWSDPLGSGFQMIQSLYAIGPGGLFGMGLTKSIQKHFYLPEPQTDFIFSIICEELGFFGALVLVVCYFILFIAIVKVSLETKDLFGKYLIMGLGVEIIFQTLLNLAVVVGLIPVTGVTLPFISYGGSSLLITMCSIGIILSVLKN